MAVRTGKWVVSLCRCAQPTTGERPDLGEHGHDLPIRRRQLIERCSSTDGTYLPCLFTPPLAAAEGMRDCEEERGSPEDRRPRGAMRHFR
jgi:hypothetical protein